MLTTHKCEGEFDSGVIALLERSDSERIEVDRALKNEIESISQTTIDDWLSETRFIRPLREFQRRDLAKILSLSHGANFSVPGSGKTTVTYAAYEILRARNLVDKLLVVAPLSAFDSWQDEANQSMDPVPRVERFENAMPRLAEVILINYQRLASRKTEIFTWLSKNRCHLVLDEAHRMKRGRNGEWGAACLELAQSSVRRDILTGTPAPQHPSDFDALLSFLWPHQATRILPVSTFEISPSPSSMIEISQRIRPLFVRTKKDELGLEPPTLRVEEVTMNPVQLRIYEAVRTRMKNEIRSKRAEAIDLRDLSDVVMYMLEAATNPALLATAIGQSPSSTSWPSILIPKDSSMAELIASYASFEVPIKFEKLAAMVAQNASLGRKTLVWTNFVANLVDLRDRVLAPYFPAAIYGAIPSSADAVPGSREGEVSRFRFDDECMVLIANPAAMSEGISLHQTCHDAIYVDRTFNAGQYLQSLDRIHRLGLHPGTETRITFLVCRDTIDETVDHRIKVKAERLSIMLDDPNLVTMALPDEDSYGSWVDDEDLDALFSHLNHE
jgi:SNF2 family DNA or RNA helicase